MALLHRVAHSRGRALLGEVGGEEARARPELGGELAQALLAAGHEHELRAVLAGEQARGGLADAARGAGDDGDGGGVGHPRSVPETGRPSTLLRGLTPVGGLRAA